MLKCMALEVIKIYYKNYFIIVQNLLLHYIMELKTAQLEYINAAVYFVNIAVHVFCIINLKSHYVDKI